MQNTAAAAIKTPPIIALIMPDFVIFFPINAEITNPTPTHTRAIQPISKAKKAVSPFKAISSLDILYLFADFFYLGFLLDHYLCYLNVLYL